MFAIKFVTAYAVLLFLVASSCLAQDKKSDEDTTPDKQEWIQLFDGKSLEGWTPKITGYELGENYGDTFRVEDGAIKVSYENYDAFNGRFGHLFYKTQYSHYRLRVTYRFVGEQAKGGPGWAYRNSGIMVHGQSPETMSKDQQFPVSIEVQLLGGNGKDKRTTMNLCTPGTHVVMDDNLIRRHCTDSTSKTYHGDQWVTVEVEVQGNKTIRHFIDENIVLQYDQPQLDDQDPDAKKLLENQDKMLSKGTISLQSESHPVEFKKVELMVLKQ